MKAPNAVLYLVQIFINMLSLGYSNSFLPKKKKENENNEKIWEKGTSLLYAYTVLYCIFDNYNMFNVFSIQTDWPFRIQSYYTCLVYLIVE